MTEAEQEFAQTVAELLAKIGEIKHFHYRPLKECFWAGFHYTCGAAMALGVMKGMWDAWDYLGRVL